MSNAIYCFWPRERIPQREDNPEVREEMRRRKLTEQYLEQRYSRKREKHG